MAGCGCMSGGKRRRTRRRSRRTKRKMSKHHRRRSSRHRRSRRSRRTRRRRGGLKSIARRQLGSRAARNPIRLLTGGTMSSTDFTVAGGYKKKKRGGTGKKTQLHQE